MSKRIITIPIPPKECSPNNHQHWRARHRANKQCRERSALEALAVRPPEPWKAATVQAIFYWPDQRRRDKDNALGRLKGTFDGLADGKLIDDDSGLTHLPVVFEISKDNPRVELIITETRAAQ